MRWPAAVVVLVASVLALHERLVDVMQGDELAQPFRYLGRHRHALDDIVEGVPMPPDVMEWLREFVAVHHVDKPFVKRKNRRHKDNDRDRQPHPGRVLS